MLGTELCPRPLRWQDRQCIDEPFDVHGNWHKPKRTISFRNGFCPASKIPIDHIVRIKHNLPDSVL